MLANIRAKSQGPVAYLIVGLITVPFALFGINQYFSGQQNITIASVDGVDITQTEYLPLFNRQKRNLQEQLGDGYSNEIDARVKQNVVSSLINGKVLNNFATELGLTTTINEVKNQILADKTFYKNGRFNLEQYQNLLRLNNYSVN